MTPSTQAEATQLCKDTYSYYATTITPATACKWKGVYFATQSSASTQAILTQNCKNQETPCLADPASTWSSPNCSDIPTDCSKTVDEYRTCLKDAAANFTQKVAALPGCDTFTSAAWTPVWDIVGADPVASCNFCPGYYPPDPKTP